MKIRNKLFVTALVVLGSASYSFAQVSANADVFATIVAPLSITKTVDMNFGNVAISSAFGGTVVLDPTGSRSTSGGTSLLPASSGTVGAASFQVTGEVGLTYDITLPGGPVDLTDGVGNFMSVSDFVSTPTPTGTLTGGSQTINVGATLYVSANQTSGNYASVAPLVVTVNYN